MGGRQQSPRAAQSGSFMFSLLKQEDFSLLRQWLLEPHVSRWWADDASLEGIAAMYKGNIDGTEPSDVFVVSCDSRPIGLVQWFRMWEYPDYAREVAALEPVGSGTWSLDYLIGDAALVGRGVGTQLIAAFVRQLWMDKPDADCIVVPVHADNIASWRVLEKVGFKRIAEGELEPDNPSDSRRHLVYGLKRPVEQTWNR